MNRVVVVAFLLVFVRTMSVGAQEQTKDLDSLTVAKLSVSEFCLCRTTMSDLQRMSNDFTEVEVEDMDYPKRCNRSKGQQYNAPRGIYSEKFKGIIFERGDFSDYLGKITLTKDFSGKLPGGPVVNLKTLTLRDVFTLYPNLKNSWGSRDCSEFWNFSDKTLSFYVKIDSSIHPQFPIKESDYLDKPVVGIDLKTSCDALLGPPRKPLQLFRQNEPMYFVDSIRTNERFISSAYQPSEFALVIVHRDADAIRIGGQEAKNGLIFIYTKEYARQKYWKELKAKSQAFDKAVRSPNESGVVYVLNGKVLKENIEADLFSVGTDDSLEITVLDKDQLKKEYHEKGKVGVVLKTKK